MGCVSIQNGLLVYGMRCSIEDGVFDYRMEC